MPASGPDPSSSTLDRLRTHAKRLTRAIRGADPDALAWVRQHLPRLARQDDAAIAASITLADVQQGVARERGSANWAALTHEESAAPFFAAVRGGDLATVAAFATEFRALAETSARAAAALGHVDALRRHLDGDAALTSARHDGWPLLAHVCASPVHRLSGRHSAGLLACATLLLDRGADVNTVAADAEPDSPPVPVSVLAIKSGNMAAMMLLMRRGANQNRLGPHMLPLPPGDPRFTRVIGDYYARPEMQAAIREQMTANWQHGAFAGGHFSVLDLRLLHDLPRAMTPMAGGAAWAVPHVDRFSSGGLDVGVTHAFPPDLVEQLLTRGFECHAARVGGRSLVAAATRAGRHDVAMRLRAHGAPDDDVMPLDELIGACMRLDADDARSVLRAHPNTLMQLTPADIDLLVAAARAGAIDHLRLLLDVGLPADASGTAGITPLHGASWHGHVDVVRLLLERRASPDVRDATYDETPRAWAAHGATHCRTADDEYREVQRLIGAR